MTLLQQLEAAGEGSRELDRQIMALTYRWEQRHIGCICWDDADDTCCPGGKHLDWVWVDPETDKWVTNAIDGFEFTASVDRALALAERVLGEESALSLLADVAWDVETVLTLRNAPCLLCAAILRARSAGEGGAQ